MRQSICLACGIRTDAVRFRCGSLWLSPRCTVSAPTTPRPRHVTLRHEQGRSYLGTVLNYWMRRSDLTHQQMARIADWGLGEGGLLSPSQISHLRNRNILRGASPRNLDGLVGANRAIHLWHTEGQEGAWRKLGPHPAWRVEREWLDGAIWLARPDDETQPLTYGDFAELSVGYLTLPYLGEVSLSPTEWSDLSLRLNQLLNSLATGGTPMEGIARVVAAYPIQDPARQARLRDLLLGATWTREELETELYALAVLVATLRGIPVSDYGPTQLHAELSSPGRRI